MAETLPHMLGQIGGDLQSPTDAAIGGLRIFSALLAIAGIILSGFFVVIGKTEYVLYALIGSAVIGLAPAIATFFISIGG